MSRTIITTAMMAALLALPALAQDVPGYIPVPGTDTKVHVYGYAQFYAQLDLNQTEGALGGLSSSPTGAPQGPTSQFYMSGNGSRLGVATITSSAALGDITTKLEFDDNGSGDAKYGAFEIRHMAMSFGNWTIGHTGSLFSDPDAGVAGIDSNGYQGGKNWDTGRFPLVQYVAKLDAKNTIGVSLEQNSQNGSSQTGAPKYYAPNVAGAQSDNKLPTLVGAYTFGDSWGHVRLSAAIQSWGFRVPATATVAERKESTVTTTLGLGTKVLIGKDNVSATLVTGKGSGAYSQGDAGLSFYDATKKEWDLIKSTGWQAGYTHTFTDAVNASVGAVGYSYTDDKAIPADNTPGHVKSFMAAFVNATVQVTKTFNYGVEYKYEKYTFTGNNSAANDKGVLSGNTTNSSMLEFTCSATF